MVEIKTGGLGADMEGVCQELYDIFPTVEDAWADYGWGTPVVTEGRREPEPEDLGEENPSLHFFGEAIDVRANFMPDDDQDELAHDLQARLGPFYQVVSEHFIDESDDHIHIEMDTCADYPYASIWHEGE